MKSNIKWPPPKGKKIAGCNWINDGWVRWYKGKTRFVCAKSTPWDQIEDRWFAKKTAIDEDEPMVGVKFRAAMLMRDVAGEYLARQKTRIDAKKDAISKRTYFNCKKAVNGFGAFRVDGAKIGDLPIAEIGPRHFSAYAHKFHQYKPSGFTSVVGRVLAMFNWAVQMEYIDKVRPGPDFKRAKKQDIRDERIGRKRSFTADEVAKLYKNANPTIRVWIALAMCGAFNNSDIGNLTNDVIDYESGVIDYRRRKTGKIRRVIPLPPDVLKLLREYKRPKAFAPEYEPLVFLTVTGRPYVRLNGCTITTEFGKLVKSSRVSPEADGRNFAGLRTSFANLAPPGYKDDVEIIMGHAYGTTLLDAYMETVGMDRLRHVVDFVWGQVKTLCRDSPAAPAPPSKGERSRSPRGRSRSPRQTH